MFVTAPTHAIISHVFSSSVSLLQTRFFNHMKDAGFKNCERGVEGSTDEHLTVVEFKVQQEQERLKETRIQATESELWLMAEATG
jgi:hypothetical protein